MFTLRIIFVGLIAFSPVGGDQGVMMLTNEPGHKPLVLLKDGQCAPAESCKRGVLCAPGTGTGDLGLCWFLPQPSGNPETSYELSLRDEKEGPVVQSSGRVRRGASLSTYPTTEAETKDMSWVPSFGKAALGPGVLRRGCQERGGNCPAWARFWIEGGSLSACHLLHASKKKDQWGQNKCGDDAGKLLLFSLRGDPQAIANAVLLEVDVPGESVQLELRQPGQTEPLSVSISPPPPTSPFESPVATLVVVNEPLSSCPKDRCELDEIGHFAFFSRFLDPVRGMAGRIFKPRPKWTGDKVEGAIGSCEDDVQWLAGLEIKAPEDVRFGYGLARECVNFFPEGASECDMATFP